MLKLLPMFAILGFSAVPATAQTALSQVENAAPQKPKMVKKRVCQKVQDEAIIGSRLGSRSTVCKTIMVPAEPAPAEANEAAQQAPRQGL
jgi:hypothetical protein